MSDPIMSVRIVRTEHTLSVALARIVGYVVGILLAALLVWLITPVFWGGFDLSYWQTLGLVYVLRILQRQETAWTTWTSDYANKWHQGK